MPHITIIVRSFLFELTGYLWTIFMFIICTPLFILPNRMTVSAFSAWGRVVIFMAEKIIGIHTIFSGVKPREGAIIACKHQSAWETFALLGYIQRPTFILKQQLLNIPFVGWYLHKMGMIGVKRHLHQGSKDMLKNALRKHQLGHNIIIFPEGYRTRYGNQPELKSGVWYLAKKLGCPVYAVALNSGRLWPRKSLIKRPGHIKCTFTHMVVGQNKKDFMDRLRKAINKHNPLDETPTKSARA